MMKIRKHFLPKTHYNERLDKLTGQSVDIDMLVFHCSAYDSDKLTQVFLDLGVSAHYIIDRDGTITQLVDETKRAWHAGVGSWEGITDINSAAIGIELVYKPGEEYQIAQIDSLIDLCHAIKSRHVIKWVIGHSDCAFARGKVDPGPYFPWGRLAQAGIGIWPDEIPHETHLANSQLLAGIGYNVDDEKAAMAAFALHFCPNEAIDSPRVRKCLEAVHSAVFVNDQK